MKFTNSDTLFLKERFPEPVKNYYSVINDSVRIKLSSMLDRLKFSRLDTSYIEDNLQDGTFYKFHLETDTLIKTVSIYGDKAPTEIYFIASWLDSMAKSLKKYPTNKQVDFADLSGVNPPPAPPPPEILDK